MKIDHPYETATHHPTFEDERGSFTAIDSKHLGINWEQFNIVVSDKS